MIRRASEFSRGRPVSAVIQSAHGEYLGKYLAKVAVPKAATFVKSALTFDGAFNQSIDAIVLLANETDTRLLEAGDKVVGELLPTRDEATGKPLLLVTGTEPCCGPFYKLYHCCDWLEPLYYVTEAEYLSAGTCVGPRFGLLDGTYYIFVGAPTETKPDLPHFPGTVTCDVCAAHVGHDQEFPSICSTRMEDIDILFVFTEGKVRLTRPIHDPEGCAIAEQLDEDCSVSGSGWGAYSAVQFAGTDVGICFANHKTGLRCGPDLPWVRRTGNIVAGFEEITFASVGYICDGDVLRLFGFGSGSFLETKVKHQECPTGGEPSMCELDFNSVTWVYYDDWIDIINSDGEWCDVCGV